MKTAVIALGLFVSLVAAECPVMKALKKGAEECKDLLNPSQETLDLVEKNQGEDNRDVQCFQACMTKKANLMNGAKFDIQEMERLMRSAEEPKDDVIKAVIGMMEECKTEAEVTDDECQVMGNYMKCTNAKREAMKDSS